MEKASAVVYTGTDRLCGRELGLAKIAGKPMIEHVLDAVPDDVEELAILVGECDNPEGYNEVAEKYLAEVIEFKEQAINDRRLIEFAVENVQGDRMLILPGNAPLITRDFAAFLLECSKRFKAVLPRSPARSTIYSMASYQTRPIREFFGSNPGAGMDEAVKSIGGAIYLSSMSLRIFDEKLGMFLRVSTHQDLKRAEKILKTRRAQRLIEL
jgi:molybdopterin-guanine dinucleotide biosynthesis protein A